MSVPTNAINCNSTDYGVVSFDGIRVFQTVVPGTSGNVLLSNGSTWASGSISSAGAITTITGDSGGAESPSAGNFTFTGASTGLTFAGSAATETLTIASSAYTIGRNTVAARDSNGNVTANNFIYSSTNTTSASGTTVLTAASARVQVLQGSQIQTYQLPNATTLSIGATFEFNNNSSGVLSIVDAASGAVATVPSGGYGRVIAQSVSTSAGSWDKHFLIPANGNYGTAGMTVTGTIAATSTIASGVAGSSIGGLLVSGNTSGTVSILPQAAAGTYNFNLPTTAGTSGYFLTSAGGGSSPMTWTAASSGGITTINGDTGSITGSTVTIKAGNSAHTCGSSVLFTNSSTTSTLSVTDASQNTLIGAFCGNLTLSGSTCTGLGQAALNSMTSASDTTCIGFGSGTAVTAGAQNTFVGSTSGASVTTSSNNTAIGYLSLNSLDTISNGTQNVAVGSLAARYDASIKNSTCIGYQAGPGSGASGTSYNVLIGNTTGSSYVNAESNNILINNTGTATESNALHIGAGTGTGTQQLNKAFISGINGVTSSNPAIVTINTSTDQMGTVPYVVPTSWTPVLAFGGASVGITYSTQTGVYSRIGNIVYFSLQIALSSKGSSTGNASITGLPLTISGSDVGIYTVDITQITFTGLYLVAQLTSGNGIRIFNEKSASGTTVLTNTEFANNSTIAINGTYTL